MRKHNTNNVNNLSTFDRKSSHKLYFLRIKIIFMKIHYDIYFNKIE